MKLSGRSKKRIHLAVQTALLVYNMPGPAYGPEGTDLSAFGFALALLIADEVIKCLETNK